MRLCYSINQYPTYYTGKVSNIGRSSISKSLLLIAAIMALSACSGIRAPQPAPTPQTSTPPQITTDSSSGASSDLKLCKMKVSNPPTNIGNSKVCVRGVELFVAPAPKACLSSGYGLRSGRQHKAIDYQSKPAGSVIAAGDGKIIEMTYRVKDYGRWIIIDHGDGIYTSYAHLKNVEQNLAIGNSVKQGQRLGMMGETGAAAQAIHLHFELRQGDYANPKTWWGLNPLNPFDQPATCS